jgi:multiphosphoryl transfer protein
VVGIVLVSHSAKLADAVVEVVREMAGPDIALEPAGGLEEPGALGTDAMLVAAALDRASSGDGVLVLMDLGSAVLSAEMALELLPPAGGDRVVLCDAPLVEGAVAAGVAAARGATLDEVAAEARGGLAGKAAHLGAEPPDAAAPEQPEPADGWRSVALTLLNPHGLHARPAARLIEAAAQFDARVEVENVTSGRGPVSARSLNALATLGARRGTQIVVRASGPEAAAALAAVRELAESGFGEGAGPAAATAAPSAEPRAAAPTGALAGVPAAPGLAAGPARRLRRREIAVPQHEASDPEAELAALERALEAAREETRATRAAVAVRAAEAEAAIFDAHLLLLEDDALLEPARRAIRDRRCNAARAWSEAVDSAVAAYRGLDDDYLRARAGDVLDVGNRVLVRLAGDGGAARPELSGPGVLVAADLTPGETAALETSIVHAIATAAGGPTSHTAILARALGIPAVAGLGDAILEVPEGTELLVDGDAGLVRTDPSAETLAEFEARRRERARADDRARAAAHEPAVTLDGLRIDVVANVGKPADVAAAVEAGAEGVGLLRTEFLFLDRPTLPGEEEQAAVYREICDALGGRPLILRTLDVGADKPLPALPRPAEANPFLGVRGIRLSLESPEVLLTQLRAALRVAAAYPLKIMFPMIATLEELEHALRLVDEARAGLPPVELELGAMIEVPAAALAAEHLARRVDFFSIGTNDLTQYALAAERGNPSVAALADPLHPAVLQLVARVVEAAEAHGRWVGVCGEAAGDPAAVPVLVGLGVRELSTGAPAVPVVKQAVRELDAGAARTLACEAMGLPSAGAVRALVREAATRTPGS